jgi:hypothetical protein
MRRRNWPSAKGPQKPRSQYGLRPPRSAFPGSPRPLSAHPLSLRWPRFHPRGRPLGRGRLWGPAQTEEARPNSIAGRPDLSVALLIIGAAVGFDLLLLVAGWMQL